MEIRPQNRSHDERGDERHRENNFAAKRELPGLTKNSGHRNGRAHRLLSHLARATQLRMLPAGDRPTNAVYHFFVSR
jgi:hypothetical protein